MKYNVRIFDFDGDIHSDIELPFVPMAGLNIRVPFNDNDYGEIHQVYWNEANSRFEVYLTTDAFSTKRQAV